jgi:crotonobetainyl-CoA:carnitine CoA-transferase CaiB-like acyl-CoA transferase
LRIHSDLASSTSLKASQVDPVHRWSRICVQIMFSDSLVFTLIPGSAVGTTTAEWLERLDAADVPCAPILRRSEIIHNEQVVARGIIAEFDQPKVGRVRQPKPAARFEVNQAAIGGPAPRVGEHSREVLRDLGYDDGAIDKMIAERALRVAV